MDINEDLKGFQGRENQGPDFRETIFTYLRHWPWFVFSIISFVLLGFIYIKISTPKYKIETDLLIKDNKGSLGGGDDLLKDLDLFSSNKIIDNEISILKSKTILEKVASSLKLETSYYNPKGVRTREIYHNQPFEATLIKPVSNPDIAYDHKLSIQLIDVNNALVNGKRLWLTALLERSRE